MLDKISVVVGEWSVTVRGIRYFVRFALTPNCEVYADMLRSNFDEGDGRLCSSVACHEWIGYLIQTRKGSARLRARFWLFCLCWWTFSADESQKA